MKKLLSLLVLIFLFAGLSAQHNEIRCLVDQYSGEEDVTYLYIPGFLFRLAATIGDCTSEEQELLRSIQSVRILVSENPTLNRQVDFVEELKTNRWGTDYHLVLSVSEDGENVRIFTHEKSGKVRELIIAASSADENVLIQMKGKMDSDLLQAVGGVIDVEAASLTKEL
jgi:hypothetical protein